MNELLTHPGMVALLVFCAILVLVILAASIAGYIAACRRISTGPETFAGTVVTVLTPLKPRGTVLLEGEIWKAVIDHGTALKGEEVMITHVKGLLLFVTQNNIKGGNC